MSDGFFFPSRRRHTRWPRDWSSDVCSSDLPAGAEVDGIHRLDPRLPCPDHELVETEGIGLGGMPGQVRAAGQIGRASCRERVGTEGVEGRGVDEEKKGEGAIKREGLRTRRR